MCINWVSKYSRYFTSILSVHNTEHDWQLCNHYWCQQARNMSRRTPFWYPYNEHYFQNSCLSFRLLQWSLLWWWALSLWSCVLCFRDSLSVSIIKDWCDEGHILTSTRDDGQFLKCQALTLQWCGWSPEKTWLCIVAIESLRAYIQIHSFSYPYLVGIAL